MCSHLPLHLSFTLLSCQKAFHLTWFIIGLKRWMSLCLLCALWTGWTSHSLRYVVTWAYRVGVVMQKDKSGHFIWMACFWCWNIVLQWSACFRNLRERMTSASKIPSATSSFAVFLFLNSVEVRSDLQCLFCSHLLRQPSCQQCLLILSQMPVLRTYCTVSCLSLWVRFSRRTSSCLAAMQVIRRWCQQPLVINPVFNILFITYKFQVICFGTLAIYLRDPRFDSESGSGLGFYLSSSVYPCLCISTNVPYSYSFIYHWWYTKFHKINHLGKKWSRR